MTIGSGIRRGNDLQANLRSSEFQQRQIEAARRMNESWNTMKNLSIPKHIEHVPVTVRLESQTIVKPLREAISVVPKAQQQEIIDFIQENPSRPTCIYTGEGRWRVRGCPVE